MGLGKLKDLRIATRNRRIVFDEILTGKINYKTILKSRYLHLIENRFHIAPQRIIKEEASRNTYENILFSGQLFDMEEAEVGIVTSNFHVFRALCLARAAGYQNVCGIAARSHFGVLPNNMLREFFGVLKDFAVGNLGIL